MKTQLTIEIEEALAVYCIENGGIVVEEVSMPAEKGIVDTLACFLQSDGTRQWRCYELKVSKADFRSKAQLSFIGDYNYYVLPKKLYEAVENEIPPEIGVLLYRPYMENEFAAELTAKGTFVVAKKPKKQQLLVSEAELTNRFMASLFREVRKAKRMEYGVRFFPTEKLYQELKLRSQKYDVFEEKNYYERFKEELYEETIQTLQEELAALQLDYDYLKNAQQIRRRPTEPLE